MDGLISDLLTLAGASRGEISVTEVDLSEVAGTTLAGLRSHEPQRRVEDRIEAGVRVLGDERLLRTVVENLLGNAWKFTSRTAGPVIEFGTSPAAGAVVHCHVRDTHAAATWCGFVLPWPGSGRSACGKLRPPRARA